MYSGKYREGLSGHERPGQRCSKSRAMRRRSTSGFRISITYHLGTGAHGARRSLAAQVDAGQDLIDDFIRPLQRDTIVGEPGAASRGAEVERYEAERLIALERLCGLWRVPA